jgi:WD40 repeat protein
MEPFMTHFNVPTKSITSLSFHPNGKRFLASSRVGGVLLYNIERQNRPVAFEVPSFAPVRSFISPDGTSVYAASVEGKIARWNAHDRKPAGVKKAHPSRVNDMDSWRANGVIITASNDKTLKAWSPGLDFLTSFIGHASQVTACSCCQTCDTLLTGDHSGYIALWDIRDSRECKWKQSLRNPGPNPIASVDFDHKGVIFCTSTEDNHLSVWDRRALDEPVSQSDSGSSSWPVPELIQSHKAQPSKACFHPKKPVILTAGGDSSPRIWDLQMSALLYSFEGHETPTCACAWAPSGKIFATADTDGIIIVWSLPKNKVVPTILYRTEQVSMPPSEPSQTILTPDLILLELELLTEHCEKLNAHLAGQEKKLSALVSKYPWVGGFRSYEC